MTLPWEHSMLGCLLSVLTAFALVFTGLPLTSPAEVRVEPPRVAGRTVTTILEGNRKVIRFDDGKDVGMLWFPDVKFDSGSVEFDVRGRDVPQRSFVGFVYHVLAHGKWDAVYLRPFNFHATDSARHAHAIQYVSAPNFDWDSLRVHFPGQYEQPLDPAPVATSWIHVRVELARPDVRVYLNGSMTAALHVKDLGGYSGGSIGIWVGDCSDGEFSDLKATPKGGATIDLSARISGTINSSTALAAGKCAPLP